MYHKAHSSIKTDINCISSLIKSNLKKKSFRNSDQSFSCKHNWIYRQDIAKTLTRRRNRIQQVIESCNWSSMANATVETYFLFLCELFRRGVVLWWIQSTPPRVFNQDFLIFLLFLTKKSKISNISQVNIFCSLHETKI